jgi:hypothetical protein
MPSVYHSESVNWSSSPKTGKVHGTHNVVTIKNGKGKRIKETLNAKGQVIKRNANTLKKSEVSRILKGKFIPNLWANAKTRKSSRRKPAA